MSDQIGIGVVTYHYRIYAADGTHLYSGTTSSVRRRFAEHRTSKTWWSEDDHVEIDVYPTRWQSLLVERMAGRGKHGHRYTQANVGNRIRAHLTPAELDKIDSGAPLVPLARMRRMTIRKALGK